MQVVETPRDMRQCRKGLPGSIGFVPTMGYLHDGHMSLVRMAREQDSSTVVSIYVNPSQFAPHEDLDTYPQDMERDLSLLEAAGVDAVFTPTSTQMYPEVFDTWVVPGDIASRLEGASRPTFFRGVATIVTKLFNVVQPDRAYFGRKDAQQLRVIRRMTEDLQFPVEIIAGETVREPDGLAMSSRNAYLNPEERRAALVLSQALKRAEQQIGAGQRDPAEIKADMERLIQAQPLARVDYISIADDETLEELETISAPALVSLAVFIGNVRLIDNRTVLR